MKKATERRLRFLLGFGVYFVAVWFLWETAAVYPIKIFVVLLHEVGHALALWATGGTVERITLDAAQGGATYGRGGDALLVLSAGYLGSLLQGAALVAAARWKRLGSGWVMGAVGLTVLALTLVFVRSLFGLAFGLVFGAALLAAARWLPTLWNGRILMALGLTSCLYAILDIKSDILDRPYLQSDAAMLAELTGIPTVVWGVLWITVAIGVSAALVRWAVRTA